MFTSIRALTLRAASLGSRLSGSRRYTTRGITSGDSYTIPPEAISAFRRDGYVVLKGVLSEAELAPIEDVYMKIMRQEIKTPGKDFCDMSQSFDTPVDQFRIINAMLPSRYAPQLLGNLYEKRAASITAQLYPFKAVIDYDQLLDKRPHQPKAVFAWHSDMAYWPPARLVGDTRTATFSLFLDAASAANGALRFIPGSGVSRTLRPHVPIGGSREDAHAIAIQVDETKEQVVLCEVERGDVTVHDEYVVHGSLGNNTAGSRRTYVVAYRSEECVKKERALGFDHSHNNPVNWDSFGDDKPEIKAQ